MSIMVGEQKREITTTHLTASRFAIARGNSQFNGIASLHGTNEPLVSVSKFSAICTMKERESMLQKTHKLRRFREKTLLKE